MTALKVSRYEVTEPTPVWNGANWSFEPQTSAIYRTYVAGFITSRCLAQKPHKIVILDHTSGEVLQVIPYYEADKTTKIA